MYLKEEKSQVILSSDSSSTISTDESTNSAINQALQPDTRESNDLGSGLIDSLLETVGLEEEPTCDFSTITYTGSVVDSIKRLVEDCKESIQRDIRDVQKVETLLDKIQTQMDTTIQSMQSSSSIQRVQSHIDKVDRLIDSVSIPTKPIDSYKDKIQTTVDQINAIIERLKTQIDQSADTCEDGDNEAILAIKKLIYKRIRLEKNRDYLLSSIPSLDTSIDQYKSRVVDVSKRLDTIKQDVGKLKTSLNQYRSSKLQQPVRPNRVDSPRDRRMMVDDRRMYDSRDRPMYDRRDRRMYGMDEWIDVCMIDVDVCMEWMNSIDKCMVYEIDECMILEVLEI